MIARKQSILLYWMQKIYTNYDRFNGINSILFSRAKCIAGRASHHSYHVILKPWRVDDPQRVTFTEIDEQYACVLAWDEESLIIAEACRDADDNRRINRRPYHLRFSAEAQWRYHRLRFSLMSGRADPATVSLFRPRAHERNVVTRYVKRENRILELREMVLAVVNFSRARFWGRKLLIWLNLYLDRFFSWLSEPTEFPGRIHQRFIESIKKLTHTIRHHFAQIVLYSASAYGKLCLPYFWSARAFSSRFTEVNDNVIDYTATSDKLIMYYTVPAHSGADRHIPDGMKVYIISWQLQSYAQLRHSLSVWSDINGTCVR